MQMEIETALGASSSSSMQLDEQIDSIKDKSDKLSISEDPHEIEREEYVKFINKDKNEINDLTQLVSEVMFSTSCSFSLYRHSLCVLQFLLNSRSS